MAKRSERRVHGSGSRPRGESTGFALQLELRPGLPLAECRHIERRLEDYAETQGLALAGHQLHQFVVATDRPVTVNDQVALLDWLVDMPGLVAARVGPIVAHQDPAGEPQDDVAFVQARTGDLAVIGLTLLYRCGRITPNLYLQILGGYVRPVNLH